MKKISKRLLALATASVMVFSLAACGNKDEKKPADDTTPANTDTENSATGTDEAQNADSYTLNLALADFPTNWNPHQQQTNIDSAEMLYYMEAPLYTFDFNETMDGYAMIPGAAVGEPVEVTQDYIGQYGLEEGAESRAWKITIRDDLMWEDGTPITAQDYVTSAELLLNPVAQNYRADSLYANSLVLSNARNYVYQGQYGQTPMISSDYLDEEYVAVEDMAVSDDGYYTVDGKDVLINIHTTGSWGSNGLDEYYGAYPELFVKDGVDLFADVFEPAADEDGYVKVNEEVSEGIRYIIAGLNGLSVADYEAAQGDYAFREWEEFCYYGETYPEMSFDEVGIFALSDTEFVIVLEKPLKGFDLRYALTSSWLVNEELYKQCESVTDGVYQNSYGTSAETTISYGPYKLVSFQADKQYVLERNDNFYGIVDGQYQTTKIQYDCVGEASTRLEMFLSGQLDSYGLTAEDMETYQSSDYTYYTTQDSTFFVALNPDLDALTAAQQALGANYNKTILTVKEFRQALSFALDRSAFALATQPTCNAAFGVYSSLIISDPENGTTYRSTDEAKWVLAEFWGVSDDIGDGKMYADVDEAIESITGYNLEMAKQLFNEAYDIAIADGLMDEDDVIEIKIGLPNNTSQAYAKGYEFLVNCYTDAVVGTSLEGKLTFSKDDTLGNGFAEALRANQVDLLFFVGWTGSALDPYNLMMAYIQPNYQYDPSWDTSADMLTINLNGTDYTASVLDWTSCINGAEIAITAADGTVSSLKAGSSNEDVAQERFEILAALEGAILSTYDMIPLVDDSSAGLKGMQVQYYSEEYIFGVGRNGNQGVQYLTYNYTDAEWEEFVASQGGTLNYN